jgi:hypothetical protein
MELNKWCQRHWDALRLAIEQRGMAHLISRGGEAAAAQVADELKMGSAHDVEGFDPLLRAWASISGRAMEVGFAPFGCPLCGVDEHTRQCTTPGCQMGTAESWVAGCTDSLRDYARGLNLIPDPS